MKKTIIFTAIYFSIQLLLFTGCATVEETLYLRQAQVTGPIICPPIHLTDTTKTPSLTVSSRFTFNTKKLFTGDVEQRTDYFRSDTTFVHLLRTA